MNLDKKGNKIDSDNEKRLLHMMQEIFGADGNENISDEELSWASEYEVGTDVVEFLTKKYNEVNGLNQPKEEEQQEVKTQSQPKNRVTETDETDKIEETETEEERTARLEAEEKAKRAAAKAAQRESFVRGINKIKEKLSTEGVSQKDYTIVKGDSMWKIAEKTLKDEGIASPDNRQVLNRLALIAKLNNIDNVSTYKLRPNKTLKVPGSAQENADKAAPAKQQQSPAPAGNADKTPPAEKAAEGENPSENTVDLPKPSNASEKSTPHPESSRFVRNKIDPSKTVTKGRGPFGLSWFGKETIEYDSEGNVVSETRTGWFSGTKTKNYSKDGKLLTEVRRNKEGKVESITAYDNDGKKIGTAKEIEDDLFKLKNGAEVRAYGIEDGALSAIGEYNSDGFLVKETSYNIDGSLDRILELDSVKLKVTKRTQYEGNEVKVHDYDSAGEEIKETIYKNNGKIVVYDKDSSAKCIKGTYYYGNFIEVKEFDGKLVTREMYYNGKRGMLDSYYMYDYNENGKNIKATCYKTNGEIEYYKMYDYDDNGNKIKETIYEADGSVYYSDTWDSFGRQTRADYSYETPPYYIIYKYDNNDPNATPSKETKYNPNGTLFVEPEEPEESGESASE